MALSDDQKWRFSQAFEKSLNPESLQEIMRLNKAGEFDQVLEYLGLTKEDTEAFGSYLEEFIGRPPLFWWQIF